MNSKPLNTKVKFFHFTFVRAIVPAASLFIIASCQKPKTWECICSYSGFNGTGKETTTIANRKQKDAERDCKAHGQELTGGLPSYTCDIQVK